MTSTRLIGDSYNGYLHGFDIGAQHLGTALMQLLLHHRVAPGNTKRNVRAATGKEAYRPEIVSVAEPVVILQPAAVDRYLSKANDLSGALRSGSTLANNELTASVRDLIEVTIVQPTPAGVAPDVEARGRIAALLGLDCFRKPSSSRIARFTNRKICVPCKYSCRDSLAVTGTTNPPSCRVARRMRWGAGAPKENDTLGSGYRPTRVRSCARRQ
jgi:hypothetical protein